MNQNELTLQPRKDLLTAKRIIPWKKFRCSLVPNWLLARTEISPAAKLCYARLCQYAGQDGKCFPTQDTLAVEIGVSGRNVRRLLNELVSYKLIEYERVSRSGTNQYFFLEHEWMELFTEPSPREDSERTNPEIERTNVAPERTDLPLDRTNVAEERTNIASERTNLSALTIRESVRDSRRESPRESGEESIYTHTPRSLDEVIEYAYEIDLGKTDAEAFYDHFSSNGWKVSGRAPMKDWRAALRTWKRNKMNYARPQYGGQQPHPGSQAARATYRSSPDDVEEILRALRGDSKPALF
jgi:hypothetical protein